MIFYDNSYDKMWFFLIFTKYVCKEDDRIDKQKKRKKPNYYIITLL